MNSLLAPTLTLETVKRPDHSSYLDGLGCRWPFRGMASGHIQKECLEPAWQGQFMVSGYTELGCCPQNCSHTVDRGLDDGGTEEKEVVTVGLERSPGLAVPTPGHSPSDQ